MRAGRSGTALITHREFIGDVSGSVAFTNTSFSINPGLASFGPWISGVAPNWEAYRFRKLKFMYKGTSGTAVGSTSTALGTVIMATNYDVADAAFTSKQQMENYQGAVDGAPFKAFEHDVLAYYRVPENAQFVRAGSVPSGSDPKLYDLGNFQIATSGMQAASVVGELWMEFTVELIKPKIQTPIGQNLLAAHYTGTATTANAFTGATARSGNTITPTFPTALTVLLPNGLRGRFFVGYLAKAGTSYTGTGIVPSVGAATVDWFVSENDANSMSAGSTTAFFSTSSVIDVTADGGLLTIASPTIVGSTTWDLVIFQIPGGLALTASLPPTLSELQAELFCMRSSFARMCRAVDEEDSAKCDDLDDLNDSVVVCRDRIDKAAEDDLCAAIRRLAHNQTTASSGLPHISRST